VDPVKHAIAFKYVDEWSPLVKAELKRSCDVICRTAVEAVQKSESQDVIIYCQSGMNRSALAIGCAMAILNLEDTSNGIFGRFYDWLPPTMKKAKKEEFWIPDNERIPKNNKWSRRSMLLELLLTGAKERDLQEQKILRAMGVHPKGMIYTAKCLYASE